MNKAQRAQLRHGKDTAGALRTCGVGWGMMYVGWSGLKMENTQVCTVAAEVKRKRSLRCAERSDVKHRQQRDARDSTSDGERWKVMGAKEGAGGRAKGVRRWSSRVVQGGRRLTMRGRGNGRSNGTVLTGHKYGEAGKVNGSRLREEWFHGGRRAHFTASEAAAAFLC